MSDKLAQIVEAHQESVRLQRAMRESAARRDALVREAMPETSAASIAAALGVDRQRVYQMAKR